MKDQILEILSNCNEMSGKKIREILKIRNRPKFNKIMTELGQLGLVESRYVEKLYNGLPYKERRYRINQINT
jgi:hypothetical protein